MSRLRRPALHVHPGLVPLLFLLGLPLVVVVAVILRIRKKNSRRAEYLDQMKEVFRVAGAEPVTETVFRRDRRHYSFDADISPIFTGELSLRFSRYCDSVHEFTKLEDVPDWGKKVEDTLGQLKWRSVSKRHVEVIVFGNEFDPESYTAEQVRADMDHLDKLAAEPLRETVRGGVVTCRVGFEKKMPVWHWKTPPWDIHRVVFSYYRGDPLLHQGIADLLYRLSEKRQFITHWMSFPFLKYAFGDSFTQSGNSFRTDNPEVAVAADKRLDGEFFTGFFSDLEGEFGNLARHRLHGRAVELLPKCDFYVRRLMDDENSWFSGEYEILSFKRNEDDLREAVKDMAGRHEARFVDLPRRFHRRLLKDNRLDEII